MNGFLILMLIIALPNLLFSKDSQENLCEFALVIPSFNNEKYYKENLDSACWQHSTNPYHIYYINDVSTDATGTLVAEYIRENGLENKITLIHNEQNIGGGANIYHTIHNYIDDNTIVVLLDGDDLFPHNNVLLTLEEYYRDPEVWMTHGVYETFPFESGKLGYGLSDEECTYNQIREKVWVTHLRTFKAGLFKKIKKEDFYYNGEMMKVTWDLAMMLPMLEMCNSPKKKHWAFTWEVLYLYRTNTPINDFKIRPQLQQDMEYYIRHLPSYHPLDFLN